MNHPNRSKICRPREHLRAAGTIYPDAWEQVDLFRREKGSGLPDWPDWCFCPLAASYAVVSGGGHNRCSPRQVADVGRLGALAAWRMTQSIYRFDPGLYARLIETPVDKLPVDILYRVPEWCVYVETPGLTMESDIDKGFRLHGFFVHLEWDAANGRPELRFVFDANKDGAPILLPAPLHLDQQTLGAALQAAFAETKRQVIDQGYTTMLDGLDSAGPGVPEDFAPFLSLLLYLCSETPDYGDRQPPANPRPKKTKKGWKLFPASAPRTWEVGVRIGAALRQAEHNHQTAQQKPGDSSRARPRPHIRRAHWHSYWTGPRDGGRRIKLRWIPPTPVNLGDQNDLPTTIKIVK